MPTRQISNPAAPGMGPIPQTGWTIPVPPLNEQVLLECVNTSATTLNHGDLVVVDISAAANAVTGWIPFPAVASPPISPQAGGVAVTTSTTVGDRKLLGVVSITGDASTFSGVIAIGGVCTVCIAGVARVQIGAQVVVASDLLGQSGTAKQAIGTTAAVAGAIGNFIGIALEATAAKDANNTIRAIIKGA